MAFCALTDFETFERNYTHKDIVTSFRFHYKTIFSIIMRKIFGSFAYLSFPKYHLKQHNNCF